MHSLENVSVFKKVLSWNAEFFFCLFVCTIQHVFLVFPIPKLRQNCYLMCKLHFSHCWQWTAALWSWRFSAPSEWKKLNKKNQNIPAQSRWGNLQHHRLLFTCHFIHLVLQHPANAISKIWCQLFFVWWCVTDFDVPFWGGVGGVPFCSLQEPYLKQTLCHFLSVYQQ